MDSKSQNKVLAQLFFVLLFCLFIGAAIYAIFGERIITDLFHGRLPFTSMTVFSGEPGRPLDYYLMRAEIIIWQFIVVGLPLTFLLWALVYKAVTRLISSIGSSDVMTNLVPQRRFKYDLLTASIVYILLTVIFSYRIFGSFSAAMIGPPEDNLFFYWNYWWANEKVLGGAGSLTYTNYMFYPEGLSMYYHSWSFYNLAISAVMRIFFDPLTTYNLIALHSFPLSGLAAFFLVRYLTKNSYLALLGGFMFAFCPYHFGRLLHHMNLVAMHFIPLFVLFYIKAIRGKSYRHALIAALFLLLNALCSWMYLIFSCMFVFFSYVYLAIRRRHILMTDVLLKSSVVVGSAVLVLSPWLWQMVSLAFSKSHVSGVGRTLFVTDIFALFVPGHYHWLAGLSPIDAINSTFTGNDWEAAVYLGLPAIIIVVTASLKILPVLAKYLAACLAFLLLSLGPELHILGNAIPVGLPDSLMALLPFVSNVRAPVRYIVYVYLFWSILVPLCTAYLIHSVKKAALKKVLLVGLPLILVVDYMKTVDEISEVSVPHCYEMIEESSERPGILDLPDGYVAMQYYKYYQTFHDHPIVQGHASRKISETLIDRLDFENLEIQKRQLTEHKVKYVMLHKDLQIEDSIPPGPYTEVYELLYEDSNKVLLKVY